MDFWITFWTWLLIGAVTVFAGLAVVVSIGGFFDIKQLFRSIKAQHAEQDRHPEHDGRSEGVSE